MSHINLTWILLIASLPTSGATQRMRLWCATRALGCVSLRDGAYLLPDLADHAASLAELAEHTNAEGGQAWVVRVAAHSASDEKVFQILFDRSQEYAELADRLGQTRIALSSQSPAEVTKAVKRQRKELQTVKRTDFFPSNASLGAEAAYSDFEDAANSLLSPDEPHAEQRPIAHLNSASYRGRTWATRRNLWVDRVASAWLIRRFIDSDAKFLWLDRPSQCLEDALGFDFDEAVFTHIGDKVTFEVLLDSFGLEKDPGLAKLAVLVHSLDVGGPANAEASGFEAILSGALAPAKRRRPFGRGWGRPRFIARPL